MNSTTTANADGTETVTHLATKRDRFVIRSADGHLVGGSATRKNADARCRTFAKNVRKFGPTLAACAVTEYQVGEVVTSWTRRV